MEGLIVRAGMPEAKELLAGYDIWVAESWQGTINVHQCSGGASRKGAGWGWTGSGKHSNTLTEFDFHVV